MTTLSSNQSAKSISRFAGPSCSVAGVLWLLLLWHQLQTHGYTQVNEQKHLLGLTWHDSAKFFVALFLLLIPGVLSVYEIPARRGRLLQVAHVITLVGVVGLMVFTAIQFWTFPWGQYWGYNQSFFWWGGFLQAMSSLVFTAGWLLFGMAFIQARQRLWWLPFVLAFGAFFTVYLTPAFPFPGLTWLVLGLLLWRRPGSPSR